eukprot:g1445.t1
MKSKGRGRQRTLNRDFGRRKKDPEEERYSSQWLQDSELKNEQFEEYYKAQGIIGDDECDAFLTSMRLELPVVFRINGRGPFADVLRQKLETNFFQQLAKGGGFISPPRAIPWYPEKLAWQFEFCRRELRRDPNFETLHEYIKKETANGSISRQEAVSMIPPLVLDVQPHHRILDMCAAPGSKTAQLLEMIHSHPTNAPQGVVVANDLDYKRCNMMTHQIRRMVSPNVLITSSDAAKFPRRMKSSKQLMEFDRILVDVPCSGDGTTRKNPEIWRKWKLHNGISLHPLQLRIVLNAARLLMVGGLLAYSTCSLNPIEDEAVVAELCRRSKGALEIVDLASKLPDLVCQRGLHHWKVKDDLRDYSSFQEVADVQNEKKHVLVKKSMFPPDKEEAMPLDRCIRLLPHLNNSGGFFVALLKKVGPIGNTTNDPYEHQKEHDSLIEDQLEEPLPNNASDEKGSSLVESHKGYFKGVDPIIDLEGHHLVQEVTEFYGLEGIDLGKNLISRRLINNEPKKVYFVSSSVKQLLSGGLDQTIRVTSLGQQVLTKQEQRKEGTNYRCIYRFCQDGLQLVLPFITKQRIFFSIDWILYLLNNRTIKIPRTMEKEDDAIDDPLAINQIRSLEQGGCVVLLDDEDARKLKLPLSSQAKGNSP